MKKMKIALAGLALLCLFGTAQAQKKYAVLITGDYAAKDLPEGTTLWNNDYDRSAPHDGVLERHLPDVESPTGKRV